MFSVIFEVRPAEGRKDAYLALAKEMKPVLESIDGFIDNERFENRSKPGWVLSHSTWRDEKSVIRWRTEAREHLGQLSGRNGIFADYHLRVGEVTADDRPPAGLALREQRFDATEVGAAKAVTITDVAPPAGTGLPHGVEGLVGSVGLRPEAAGLVEHDAFDSLREPGRAVVLAWWRDAEAASGLRPCRGAARRRSIRVIRDYAMRDRREAPQYYPDVPATS